jgi:hypothetical protein
MSVYTGILAKATLAQLSEKVIFKNELSTMSALKDVGASYLSYLVDENVDLSMVTDQLDKVTSGENSELIKRVLINSVIRAGINMRMVKLHDIISFAIAEVTIDKLM